MRCGPLFSSFSCIGFYRAAHVVISLPVCHAQPERRTKQRPDYGGKDVAANEAKITIVPHSTAIAKLPDISNK